MISHGKSHTETPSEDSFTAIESVRLPAASSFRTGRKFQSGVGGCVVDTSAPPHCVGFVLLIRPHASRIQESKSSQPAPLTPHTAQQPVTNYSVYLRGGLKTLSIHNAVQRSLPSFPNLLPLCSPSYCSRALFLCVCVHCNRGLNSLRVYY